MAKIATKVAGDAPVLNAILPGEVTPIDITGLGTGLSQLGTGIVIGENRARREAQRTKAERDRDAAKAEIVQAKSDSLWVRQQTLEAQRFMTELQTRASLVPSKTAHEDAMTEWDEYVDGVQETAPSDSAADFSALALGSIEVGAMPGFARVEGAARTTEETARVSSMVGSAHDIVAIDRTAIDSSIEQVSAGIKEMVDVLYTADQANILIKDVRKEIQLGAIDVHMKDDQTWARATLAEVEGISGQVRAGYEKKIRAYETAGKSVNRTGFALDAADSFGDVALTGTTDFDPEPHFATLTKEDEKVARRQYKSSMDDAKATFALSADMLGKDARGIDVALSKFAPSAESGDTNREIQRYKLLETMADAAKKEILDAPWVAAAKSPILAEAHTEWGALGEGERTPEGLHDLIAQNVAQQIRQGTPYYAIQYASPTDLEAHALSLSEGSSQERINRIKGLSDLYGPYYPDVFRNLEALPNGAGVGVSTSVLNDSIRADGSAPGWVHKYIDTLNLDPIADLKFESDEVATFKFDAADTTPMAAMQQSIVGAGGPEQLSRWSDLGNSIAHYAMVLNKTEGMSQNKALATATERMISANYKFGDGNGISYAIPVKQDGWTVGQKERDSIDFALEDMLANTDRLEVILEESQWQFGENTSADFKSTTINSAMENLYWALNSTDDGVVLRGPTTEGGPDMTFRGYDIRPTDRDGEPIRENGKPVVIRGEPIEVLFKDALNYKPSEPAIFRIQDPVLQRFYGRWGNQ